MIFDRKNKGLSKRQNGGGASFGFALARSITAAIGHDMELWRCQNDTIGGCVRHAHFSLRETGC